LGALPLGTANVYAAEVKLPFGQDEIAACLTAGKTRTLRVGTVSPLGEGTERHFVLMAGAGFDAQVVAKVDPTVKRLIGRGAYAIETLGTLFRADAACPTLVVDGDEVPTGSAIAVNARYYAGRFVLSKKADPFTPGMDLCLFHKTGRQAAIGYLVRVALGQIENSPVYSIKRVSSFDVTGPEGAAIQADGDIVAHAPCRISIADRTLEAIVPP
ncbi:MAG: diacylglycerol kinase family lipid kinase, partial [Pseudomonadota bacterium]